jgi:ABC-2 type transport system ATP-binding protein
MRHLWFESGLYPRDFAAELWFFSFAGLSCDVDRVEDLPRFPSGWKGPLMSIAIEARDLSFRYKNANTDALQGLSFQAQYGKITGLLGPNGSGKSTAFKIISTQILPDGGESFVGGASSLKNPKQVRTQLGVTFQSPSLDPLLTVRENLRIHAALLGLKGRSDQSVDEKMKFMGVHDRAEERVKTLSGGLQRRVELAKTLMGEPKILLLDEPTTGLDPVARADFWGLLRQIAKSGVGILVTTHLMEEAELCDELLFIAQGKLSASGTPLSLKSSFPYEVLWLEGDLSVAEVEKQVPASSRVRQEADRIRVETQQGLTTLDELRNRFATRLKGFSWGKASLADVYFEKSGVQLK